ncbi:MAG: hypothetical protein WD969_11355, partial [Paracoccaceae bacterium]
MSRLATGSVLLYTGAGREGKGMEQAIWALGLMSGTSMDGVDAALLRTDGETIAGFGPSGFTAFEGEETAPIAAIMADWR